MTDDHDYATKHYVDEAIATVLEEVVPLHVGRAVKAAMDEALGNGMSKVIRTVVDEELEPLKRVQRVLWGEGDEMLDHYRPGLIAIAFSLNQQANDLRAIGKVVRWLLPVSSGSALIALAITIWRAVAG